MKQILPFLFFSSFSICFAKPSERLISAIHQIESGGSLRGDIVGDNGKAIGPFQIHLNCWKDAVEFDRTIGGNYSDCFKYDYARKVLIAYLTRYGKGKTEIEMARIWNGGPSGHKKSATVIYGEKVRKILNK